MKLAKKLKSNKGFTLVELVVVIAVLAILAGVGSVAYSGYIKKANEAADVSLLAAVKTAADSAVAVKGGVTTITVNAASGTISTIVIKPADGSADITCTVSSKSTDTGDAGVFWTLYGDNTITLSSETYSKGATWSGGKWTAGGGA